MRRKTAGILLLALALPAAFAGCSSNEATEAAKKSAKTEQEGTGGKEEPLKEEAAQEEEKTADEGKEKLPAGRVAVLMPDGSREPWNSDGEALRTLLEEKNYQVESADARGDASRQIAQIEAFLEEEPAAMILTPVDSYGLTDVLARVDEQGIPVFNFDELVMNTDGLDYFVTFDHRAMGNLVGEEIVKAAELEKCREEQRNCTIEFFMGSQDDLDALFFFNGVKEVLKPYMEDGTLVCPSGLDTFEETGVLRQDRKTVEDRMAEQLETVYQDAGRPDIICAGFQDAAEAAEQVLRQKGFSPLREDWPLITGFDCEREDLKGIEDGWLSCSVFLDRGELAAACVEMLDTLLKGETPEVSDYSQYDNGMKIIATRTCVGKLVNQENYQELQKSFT